MGLDGMLSGYEHFIFKRTQVQVPAPMWGIFQLPVTQLQGILCLFLAFVWTCSLV